MSLANVILVLGQSNAMGYATSPNGGPNTPYPGGWTAQMIGSAYAEAIWTGSSWVQYIPGSASTYPPANSCWGPEASIALAKRSPSPQRTTYIFKYAVGGVGLAQNPSGDDWSPYSASKTFWNFYQAYQNAAAQLVSYNILPIIDECYWIGNESDCFSTTAADALARDFPMFVRTLRLRLSSPDMKFIIARTKDTLGSVSGPLPYVGTVRAAQTDVCLPSVAWVDCDDLASGTISTGHYDPASLVTMGCRMASAAL
jgi:hypothetical protein